MTLASVESGLKGARMEAAKSEVFGSWLGRPADTLSQHWRLLAYAWPAPCLPGISLPGPSSPRAPRAAGEARRGVALPGWSPAPPPPAAPSPSSGSGCAAPGNLRTPQPMGGRRPGPLPFSGAKDASSSLRSPPLAARGVAGGLLCLHAGPTPAPTPRCARPPSQHPTFTHAAPKRPY